MSTKFKRIQQQRKQFAEQGSMFCPDFLFKLDALCVGPGPAAPGSRGVALELQAFANIQSSIGELKDLQNTLQALQQAVTAEHDAADVALSCELVAELLFLQGASLLHKPILASVRRLPPRAKDLFGACVSNRLVQLAAGRQSAADTPADQGDGRSGATGGAAKECHAESAALSSLLVALINEPFCLPWIRPCSTSAAYCLSDAVRLGLAAIGGGGVSLAPPMMAEMQNAVSALHHIIGHHGRHMCETVDGADAVAFAAETMLEVLQGDTLMRETLTTAGVVVYSSALLPITPPAAVLLSLAQGMFVAGRGTSKGQGVSSVSSGGCAAAATALTADISGSVVEAALRRRGSSLAAEVQRFSQAGRVCALRGLLTAVPVDVLCTPMGLQAGAADCTPWSFLLDGALAYASDLVASTQDAHIKYHAAAAVAITLDKLRCAWDLAAGHGFVQSAAASAAAASAAAAFPDGAAVDTAAAASSVTPSDITNASGLQREIAAAAAAVPAVSQGDASVMEFSYIDSDDEVEDSIGSAVGAQQAGDPSAGNNSEGAGFGDVTSEQQQQAASTAAAPPPWLPPLLTPVDRDRVTALLFSNMDEPIAQTIRQVQEAFEMLLETLAYQNHFVPLPARSSTSSQPPPPLPASATNAAGTVFENASAAAPAVSDTLGDGGALLASPVATISLSSPTVSSTLGDSGALQRVAAMSLSSPAAAAALHTTGTVTVGNSSSPPASPAAAVELDEPHSLLVLQPHAWAVADLMALQAGDPRALSMEQFVESVSRVLVSQPLTRKNRYQPLAAIARRAGAMRLLRLQPDLLYQALESMVDGMVTNSATQMLGAVLEALRDECGRCPIASPQALAAWGGGRGAGAAAGDAAGAAADGACGDVLKAWESWWLPAFMQALLSPSERLRSCVSSRALPVLLGLEVRAALALLRAVLRRRGAGITAAGGGGLGEAAAAAAVSILKGARSMQLLGDLDALERQIDVFGTHPEQLLVDAALSASEALRMDVLELACFSPRYSEAPGRLELTVASRWLVLNLRHTSPGPRAKCVVLLHKLISRIRVAACAIVHRRRTRGGAADYGRHPGGCRGGNVTGIFELDADATARDEDEEEEEEGVAEARVLARMQSWMQWCTRLLLDSLYPGAPFERMYFAMQLINVVLEVFAFGEGWDAAAGGTTGAAAAKGFKPGRGGGISSKSRVKEAAGGGGTTAAAGGGTTAAAGGPRGPSRGGDQALPASEFQALCDGFLSRHTVDLMLAGLHEGWDKIRQTSESALSRLPSPLPSLTTPGAVLPLLRVAATLLWSPRQRESDAGARMVLVFFNKYVWGMSWTLTMYPQPYVTLPRPADPETYTADGDGGGGGEAAGATRFCATMTFLESVLSAVEGQVSRARTDLLAACRDGLCHNPLLLLRYVSEGIDWAALAAAPHQAAQLRAWMARLLAAFAQAVELSLPAVSRPTLCGAQDVDAEEGGGRGNGDGEDDGADEEEEAGDEGGGLGPEAQIITTASWMTVKEVAFLSGTLAQRLPLPATAMASDKGAAAAAATAPCGEFDAAGPRDVVTVAQLAGLGQLLLDVLLQAKHNGAVQKAAVGLQALAERVLRCSDARLNALPAAWMRCTLARLQAPGQGLDDIVRRSGGLPFAINALLLSEPASAPKVIMAAAMGTLLHVANETGRTATAAGGTPSSHDAKRAEPQSADSVPPAVAEYRFGVPRQRAAGEGGSEGARGGTGSGNARGIALQVTAALGDPWPRVHAFNCLRQAFHDTGLAVDCAASYAPGIEACILGMAADSWEVRNAASLCFTILVSRVIGFKNIGRWDFSKKAVTCTEFFQRYPTLHAFLLRELRLAVDRLLGSSGSGDGAQQGSKGPGGGEVHPSLYPTLIILSRLRSAQQQGPGGAVASAALNGAATSSETLYDSGGASAAASALSPTAFVPLVRACAAARPAAVRSLAAAALGPLLPPSHLHAILGEVLAMIPVKEAVAVAAGNTADVAPRVQDNNALHGALLQLEALLRGRLAVASQPVLDALLPPVLTRLGDAVWLVAGADLPPAARKPDLGAGVVSKVDQSRHRQTLSVARTSVPLVPGAVRGAYFQVATTVLQLLPAGQCGRHAAAIAALQMACAQCITGVPAGVDNGSSSSRHTHVDVTCAANGAAHVLSSGVDYPDVQLSLCLKAAVHLWLGPVLTAQVLTDAFQSHFSSDGHTSQGAEGTQASADGGATGGSGRRHHGGDDAHVRHLLGLLVGRLGVCVASASYDVRAAALQQLKRFLELIIAHSGDSPPGHCSTAARAADRVDVKLALLAGEALAGQHTTALAAWREEVQTLLWNHLAQERCHKVVRRLLQALGLLHELQSITATSHCAAVQPGQDSGATSLAHRTEGMHIADVGPAAAVAAGTSGSSSDGSVVASPWVRVDLAQRVLSGTRELAARCEALRCLGRALGPCLTQALKSNSSNPDDRLIRSVQSFCVAALSSSETHQPDTLRLAALDAWDGALLLHLPAPRSSADPLHSTAAPIATAASHSSASYSNVHITSSTPCAQRVRGQSCLTTASLQAWRSVLALLEDEETDVRGRAAALVQRVIASHNRSTSATAAAATTAAAVDDAGPAGSSLASGLSVGSGAAEVVDDLAATSMATAAAAPLCVDELQRRAYQHLVDVALHAASLGTPPATPATGDTGARAASDAQCSLTDGGHGVNGDHADGAGVDLCGGIVRLLLEAVFDSTVEAPTPALQPFGLGVGTEQSVTAADGMTGETGSGTADGTTIGTGSGTAGGTAVEASGTTGGTAVGTSGVAQRRKLFDREVDNRHEEPLMTAQLAGQALRRLLEALARQTAAKTASTPAGALTLARVASTCLEACTQAAASLARLLPAASLNSLDARPDVAVAHGTTADVTSRPSATEHGGSPAINGLAAVGASISLPTRNAPDQPASVGAGEVTRLDAGLLDSPEAYPYLYRLLLLLWAVPPQCLTSLQGYAVQSAAGGGTPVDGGTSGSTVWTTRSSAAAIVSGICETVQQAVSPLVARAVGEPGTALSSLLLELGATMGWSADNSGHAAAAAAAPENGVGGRSAVGGSERAGKGGRALCLVNAWRTSV